MDEEIIDEDVEHEFTFVMTEESINHYYEYLVDHRPHNHSMDDDMAIKKAGVLDFTLEVLDLWVQ